MIKTEVNRMTKLFGLHETLEVHELLTFKNLALTKSIAMSGLAQDAELKALLTATAAAGKKHIHELEKFLIDTRALQ